MDVVISEDPNPNLAEYATIPIHFQVRLVFDVSAPADEGGELLLVERNLDTPYLKNYDAIDGEHPSQWSTRFNLSNWGFLAADEAGRRVGEAVVAFNAAGLDMLKGRADIAVMWDLRVAPKAREQGVGSALFRAAETWTRARNCRELIVETQNTNVPACRFYQRQGCVLVAANRLAYPGFPNEIQLIWQKAL